MPNHVHLLLNPRRAPAENNQALKRDHGQEGQFHVRIDSVAVLARRKHDHLIRQQREFEKIRSYIEKYPVGAELVVAASEYRSSAGRATGGSPADQGTLARRSTFPTAWP